MPTPDVKRAALIGCASLSHNCRRSTFQPASDQLHHSHCCFGMLPARLVFGSLQATFVHGMSPTPISTYLVMTRVHRQSPCSLPLS